jgi:ABC-type sugar transport system ATPase subunit
MGHGVRAEVLRANQFTSVLALDAVDLEVRAGEVHALIGENGAGKSTLVKVLAGLYPPRVGTVLIDGAPVWLHCPQRARKHGIVVIYQEPTVVAVLSVADNPPSGSGRLRVRVTGRLGVKHLDQFSSREHQAGQRCQRALPAPGVVPESPVVQMPAQCPDR